MQRMSESEVFSVIDAAARPVVVEVMTSWCVPCRLLAPLVQGLAAAFPVEVAVVDGDAAPDFRDRYAVTAIPDLLVFRDGRVVARASGFSGYDGVRQLFSHALGQVGEIPETAGEDRVRTLAARALQTFEATVCGPRDIVDRHIARVAPELDDLQVRLNAEVAAGTLGRQDAGRRLAARHEALFAPFRAESDALDRAEEEALKVYAATFARSWPDPRDAHGTDCPDLAVLGCLAPDETPPSPPFPEACHLGDAQCDRPR